MSNIPLLAEEGLCTKSRRNISDSHSPICNPQQRYAITVSDKPKESLRILPIFVQYRGLRVADLGLRTETRFRLFVQSPSPQGGEGCVINKISRSYRSRRSRGGFPTVAAVWIHRKTTPALPLRLRPIGLALRFQRKLRAFLLIARPPLLAVMQGGE